jgi:hypothetical protein
MKNLNTESKTNLKKLKELYQMYLIKQRLNIITNTINELNQIINNEFENEKGNLSLLNIAVLN